VGINEHYGWYEPDVADLAAIVRGFDGGKPIVITEVGAEAPAGHRVSTGALFTEERMAQIYEAQVAQLPEIRGFCTWLLYDFRSERRQNSHQHGFNRKGVIAADKTTRKAAFAVLQRFYRGLR
jgi:beta-glucuronidase